MATEIQNPTSIAQPENVSKITLQDFRKKLRIDPSNQPRKTVQFLFSWKKKREFQLFFSIFQDNCQFLFLSTSAMFLVNFFHRTPNLYRPLKNKDNTHSTKKKQLD